MRSRHTALVGYYGHGNFGDDCYAVLLGLALQRFGVPVTIHGLCDAYAKPFGFRRAASADELLEGADALLWGGGGLLVSWPDLVFQLRFPGVSAGFEEVVSQAIGKGLRLGACSVGGDGGHRRRITPAFKERFAGGASFMTVRNPQDLGVLSRLGVMGEYHPDLMWLAGEYFPQPVRRGGGMRIGIDLYPSTVLSNFAPYLVAGLQQLVNERPDCQFYLVDSTNAGCRPYRGLGRFVRGANVGRHQFSSLEEDLQFLASLDLLVSSRLHAPMMALQFGVPAISLLAEGKTDLLFANLDLAQYSFGHFRMRELYRLMRCKRSLDVFLRDYRFPDIPRVRSEAEGHLSFLRAQLAEPCLIA